MISADIVVKTFPGDYEWLPYLWRSIAKYATGWRNLIAIIEEQYEAPPLPDGARLVRCRRYEGTSCPSYNGVAIERLGAWRHSDAEVLIFVDSDCVFCRPVNFQTDPTINLAHPVALYCAWEDTGPQQKWRAPARASLRFEPPVLTMCRYPFVYPRKLVQECWEWCKGEERLSTIYTTDWEVLGNFAFACSPYSMTWTHVKQAGPQCIWQFWNRGGVTHPLTEQDIIAGKMGGGVANEGVQAKMRALGLTGVP